MFASWASSDMLNLLCLVQTATTLAAAIFLSLRMASELELSPGSPVEASLSMSDEPGPSCDTPRSSRKRVRKEDTWKATQRKKKRNSGEAYTSKRGKEVEYDTEKGGTCFYNTSMLSIADG